MAPLQLYLICFATGSVIHAVQIGLVARLWRPASRADCSMAIHGLGIGVGAFLWQFGNFIGILALSLGFSQSAPFSLTGDFIRNVSLVTFPLSFSYMCLHFTDERARVLIRFGRFMRYPLWPWTFLAAGTIAAAEAGFKRLPVNPNLVAMITLYLMLMFFLIFTARSLLNRREAGAVGLAAGMRAHRAGSVSAILAAGLFIVMLVGYQYGGVPFFAYVELAAMMTSVPFSIAVAYKMYQFPFMDTFLREVLSGIILLAAFVAAFAIEAASLPRDLLALWVSASALLLAYTKEPVTRWVDRTFLGHRESIEEQEERVGTAIRALTRLDEFAARVSEILKSELEAEWIEIGASARSDATQRFEISASASLWLSVGPRIGGRHHMSRELRLARTAALQLSAHHHQLSQYELRSVTARAQMRALQAQINPHFLFNTLNVLANLIHTNPVKAERVTEELADIFRYALESTRAEWVSLDDELHFLESYLEIEKARFEERLVYSFEIDPAVRTLRIPPMILQPLVENAITHGIAPKTEGGGVRITARMDSDSLLLSVEDTGVGLHVRSRHRGNGIGLGNVRERLQHIYGDSGSLKLEDGIPAGTKALLTLPQLVGVHS